ncbi:MAG: hypothetical protein H9Q67_05155, partial [Spiroplasma ixodetis]|nr:hypothetical protein [Spiroplasma ixodetis]
MIAGSTLALGVIVGLFFLFCKKERKDRDEVASKRKKKSFKVFKLGRIQNMEQLKILEIINRWGYLNSYQIALLLNKDIETVKTHLRFIKQKQLILINKVTRKNIYYLSNLGKRYLGKENNKSKLNLNQLAHQDLMIKWLSTQKDIASYENELELKSWNSKQERYPDLMIEYENGTKVWVEIERTRKSKERIEDKLDNMREHIKENHKVIWVVPDEKMTKFIQE